MRSFGEILRLQKSILTPELFAKKLRNEIQGREINIEQAIKAINKKYDIFGNSLGETNPLIIADKISSNKDYQYIAMENWTERVAREMGINQANPLYQELNTWFKKYFELHERHIKDKLKSRSTSPSGKWERINNVPDEITSANHTTYTN